MTRVEKLQTMHLLWEDLAAEETSVESPEWHRHALAETAADYQSGAIKEIDWETAKQQLRSRAR